MRQYKKIPTLVTALVFGLLAVLAVSLILRPHLATGAQERTSVEVRGDGSLFEAQSAGMTEETPVIPQSDAVNSPDGGSCSWVADTVYPV